MQKFLRDDGQMIGDIYNKISQRLYNFAQIYMSYLSFLSTLNKDNTNGKKWAPKNQGMTTLFKIAFDIITTSLKRQYKIDGFDYDDIHLASNELMCVIKTNCELGNILLVCADEFLLNNKAEYNVKFFLRNTIYKFDDKEINTVIFVPLSECANCKNFLFLKFKDFFPEKERELYNLCVRYFDKDIFSRYLDKPKDVKIMSISEYISCIKGIEVRKLESLFFEIESLIDYLDENKIGSLFTKYKEFFFELFKISSNVSCNTNYYIDKNKLTLNFFGHSLIYDCYDDTTSIVDLRIVETANKNIDILKETNVYQLLMTSEYLILEYEGLKDFDNTFIVSGYFKSIELLLYKLLEKHYLNIKINDVDAIDVNLDIGKMNEIVAVLTVEGLIDKSLGVLLFDKIEKWKNVRNGYFHKHILNASECVTIKNLTCELIFYLIGILPSRQSQKCVLNKPNKLFYFDDKIRKINSNHLKNI